MPTVTRRSSASSSESYDPSSMHAEVQLCRAMSLFRETMHMAPSADSIGDRILFLETSAGYIYWKMALIIVIIYDAIAVPFQLAFAANLSAGVVETAITVCFCVDVIVQFNTIVALPTGGWLTKRTDIALRYIKTWFLVDFLSAFPFEVIGQCGIPSLIATRRLIKLLRLFTLLKIVRLARVTVLLQSKFALQKSIVSCLRFVLTVLFLSHWCACIHYGLSTTEDAWSLTANAGFLPQVEQYVMHLQWSMSTLFPIGYGDVPRYDATTQLFSTLIMAIGAFLFTFAIANLIDLIHSADFLEECRFTSLMERLEAVIETMELSDDLRADLTEFWMFNRRSIAPDSFDEEALINELSRELREDVTLAVNRADEDDPFIVDCVLAMESYSFPPGETISQAVGAICVIITGTIEQNGFCIGPGAHFGHFSSTRGCRDALPRTLTWARINILTRERMMPILVRHPNVQGMFTGAHSNYRIQSVRQVNASVATDAIAIPRVIDMLTMEQAQALLMTAKSVQQSLVKEENIIAGVDDAFADQFVPQSLSEEGSLSYDESVHESEPSRRIPSFQ